ncbi:glycerophosphodiester phosphodiesterase [Actinoplanes auranticolor]|uniref:Glycerophosphoryl diester phosphodiesterase n=1 Tax=Actinoplanes auranticolor TaxID=47988 RepID=A0A919VQE2_9ACTN|nr:glycerophosphodiester phosphodiesterase family protein [Actinoplanes auranticolor]GIM65365.1 glycerophosphoryl diester phosphodiesterase [Actinoplanes auranticolor]
MAGLHRVAHRGYSAVAPENTLPALAAGVLAGATLIEFDVRTTADGVPVVIHDRTVDRTTGGTGHIWELTLDEISALEAGSWFSPAYAGTRIPLLREVIDLLRPHAVLAPSAEEAGVTPDTAPRIELLLEIKPPTTPEQVKVILGQVTEAGLRDRTVVQSFDPEIVQLVGEVAPDVRLGLLRHGFDDEQARVAKELRLSYVNPNLRAVLADPPAVAALADAGVGVMPWTPNDTALWPALVEAGVAGLINDRTGELTGWMIARGLA